MAEVAHPALPEVVVDGTAAFSSQRCPPRIRALRDAGGKLARPEVLAVVRALHRAPEPLSKDQLLAATSLEEKSWPPLIKFLVEVGLVAAQGKAHRTRYTLT